MIARRRLLFLLLIEVGGGGGSGYASEYGEGPALGGRVEGLVAVGVASATVGPVMEKHIDATQVAGLAGDVQGVSTRKVRVHLIN